jgi:multidrug resistance efflux pump
VGGIVAPGGYPAAVVFAPAGPFIVRAEVEQEYLGRVKEGMKVLVQDENRTDNSEMPGKIKSISKWVAQRRTVLLEPGEINDVRTLECVIELDAGPLESLSIGQRMRVRIKR